MSPVSDLKGTLLLCDWAEVVGGKLYAQGIGWTSVLTDRPVQFAVGCLIRVPYDKTNEKHTASVKLTTDDGQPFPTAQPVDASFEFEIGRPPGMKPGEEQDFPFSIKLVNMIFAPGGYRFDLDIDDQPVDTVSFVARHGAHLPGNDLTEGTP
jgi:hypothetical protein